MIVLCTFGTEQTFGAGGPDYLLVKYKVYKFGILRSILHDQATRFTIELC